MAKIEKDLVPVQALLVPKPILYTGKILSWISPFLASRFGARIFLTPFKYKMPEREKEMYKNSKKTTLLITKINREVIVYQYGDASKMVLLVHGWSGSGTQLSKIADQLLQKGYSTISFDAPAHGKAPGKRSIMPHFIETIHQLDREYGPFDSAVGHSLGGMSLLRATKFGLSIKRLVIIGTANSITAITKDFAKNMQLGSKTGILMKAYFDQKFGEDLDNYSGSISANGVKIPTLVIHDKNDVDVHYSSAYEILEKLEKGSILLTEKLGHRKILGNTEVIDKIVTFIQQ